MKSMGVSIPIDTIASRQLPLQYDANKQRRRFTIWRTWNRFSKLQRYLLTCIILLILILVFVKLTSTDTTPTPAQHPNRGPPQAPQPFVNVRPNPEEILIGEDKPNKKEQVERILSPDGEEAAVDSFGGGNGEEEVDESNKVAITLEKLQEKVVTKGEEEMAVERMQENMVMPRPRIFSGPDNERQRRVVEAFQHAWDAYKRHAWGHDELRPISRGFKEWFHVGLTLVDSLDTMYIMGLTKEFEAAKKWVTDSLTFDKDVDVNLFEITIRVVGGLLSAYHLSGEDIFKQKALDLGERLTAAFTTESGVPYSDVNLRKSTAHAPKWGPDSSSAEVTTIQLEFRDLTYVSNQPKYEKLAFKVSEHFHKLKKKDGLIPIFINALTGELRATSAISFGARGDSYYEYLLKQWIQEGKRTEWLRSDFADAIAGARKHLIKTSKPSNLVFIGELVMEKFSPKMDALACFLPGTLTLAYMNGLPVEMLTLAESLLNTCHEMYIRMPTRLGPEIAYFKTENPSEVPNDVVDIMVKDNDAHALLRPEFVESLFYMYRSTKNHTYQDWGWDVFQAIEKYAKISSGGYASISDVRRAEKTEHRDHMESFLLGETFKYLYLLLGDDQTLLPLDEYVFNSEAHPLPIRKG